ncbi:MAG: hypothetical protein Q8S13_14820 [Dehalococcoidia bacterium]|nr:hypothetical protein [Dehalococcoidia bacterium]
MSATRRLLAACAVFAVAALVSAAEPAPPVEGLHLPYRYDPGTARDPFIALVREGRLIGGMQPGQTDMGKPVLFGILWDPGGRSIALINDVEAKVGDTVGAYRVVEIRPDAVVMSDGGEPLVLTIAFEEPPKTPSEP